MVGFIADAVCRAARWDCARPARREVLHQQRIDRVDGGVQASLELTLAEGAHALHHVAPL